MWALPVYCSSLVWGYLPALLLLQTLDLLGEDPGLAVALSEGWQSVRVVPCDLLLNVNNKCKSVKSEKRGNGELCCVYTFRSTLEWRSLFTRNNNILTDRWKWILLLNGTILVPRVAFQVIKTKWYQNTWLTKCSKCVTRYVVSSHLQLYYTLVFLQSL